MWEKLYSQFNFHAHMLHFLSLVWTDLQTASIYRHDHCLQECSGNDTQYGWISHRLYLTGFGLQQIHCMHLFMPLFLLYYYFVIYFIELFGGVLNILIYCHWYSLLLQRFVLRVHWSLVMITITYWWIVNGTVRQLVSGKSMYIHVSTL